MILRYLVMLCVFVLLCADSSAAGRRKRRNYHMTERDMVSLIISCLQTKDPHTYTRLFPESDSVSYWVMQVSDPSSPLFFAMLAKLENPEIGMREDSALDARLIEDFNKLISRGEQMGVNWPALVPVRHELVQVRKTRDTLLEKLAPVRFRGYIFLRDMLTRKTYGIGVTDIFNIQGSWYGGYLAGIYEAATIDEYMSRQAAEQKRIREGQPGNFGLDAVRIAVDTSEEPATIRKQLADRKLFTGMFDNEIPVELYIRYFRGGCPEEICSWEALFKFGDQDEYEYVNVTRTPDGTWHFEEETGPGVMDLTLKGNTYTGRWVSATDQTEYDVELTETPVGNKKLRRLDELFER
jgi:hypothetical protein